VQELPDEALHALKKSLELTFNVDWALLTAIIHSDVAEYDSAIPILEKAIEADPNNGDLFGLKGWVLENRGIAHAQDAYQAYETAQLLQPDELAWQIGLGNSFYLLKKLDRARDAYEKVLSRADELTGPPSNTMSLIGWAYFRLGRFDEAIKSFIALVRENPADIANQFNLALTLFGSKQPSLAEREYERGIEIANRKPTSLQRGWFYVALDDMNVALAVEPKLYQTDEFEQVRELVKNAYDASKNKVQLISQNRNESNTATVVE
jgi:tetratricopeptide (TPR) repeat protein